MKYPIGIQSFANIREDGYAYVDKTAAIYEMASKGKYYFLSRPRRFGKSLLLSTMKAYFEGKRELFDGLAIAQLEQEWKQYPVLHLDLNTAKYTTPEALVSLLGYHLSQWEKEYSIDKETDEPSVRFRNVITRAAKQSETDSGMIKFPIRTTVRCQNIVSSGLQNSKGGNVDLCLDIFHKSVKSNLCFLDKKELVNFTLMLKIWKHIDFVRENR